MARAILAAFVLASVFPKSVSRALIVQNDCLVDLDPDFCHDLVCRHLPSLRIWILDFYLTDSRAFLSLGGRGLACVRSICR